MSISHLNGYFVLLCIAVSVPFSLQDHDILYQLEENELATKINCQVNESRHYRYSSIVDLFSDIEGRIILEADLALFCLGDDQGGQYGKEALKYAAEISNLKIEEQHKRFDEPLRRRKRGIGDWFYNAWISVKNFFINLFGGSTEDSSSSDKSDDWSRVEETTPRQLYTERTILYNNDEVTESPRRFSTRYIKDITEDPTSPTPTSPTTAERDELEREDEYYDYKYRDLYSTPFVFVQLLDGSVPEVRFASNDSDGKVRNFKRHLVDVFATHLSMNPTSEIVETSVMGKHRSQYNITVIITMGPMSSPFSAPDGKPQDEGKEKTVIVEKKVTNQDILTLAPTTEKRALNNKDKLELEARQTQIFENGDLVSSTGTSNLVLFPDFVKEQRTRRAAEDDSDESVLKYIQAHTQHQLQLQKRKKRSLEDNYLEKMMDGLSFSAASREAEAEDSAVRQRLRDLQLSLGNPAVFINELLDKDGEIQSEKLQNIFEAVDQEVRYSLDEEPESITRELRIAISHQRMDHICSTRFKRCLDLLQLLAKAGGSKAEEILLYFITVDRLRLRERQEIADLISDLSNPSSKVMKDLNTLLRGKTIQPPLLGSLALSASNMVSRLSTEQKKAFSETLSGVLESNWSPTQPDSNLLAIDILEAFGNIGSDINVDQVLKLSEENPDKLDLQIACAHALRQAVTKPRVRDWMKKVITSGPCDVIHSVVGSLLDQIHVQQMAGDEISWPRNGFSEIDVILRDKVTSSAPEIQCAAADISRYLHKKNVKDSKEKVHFFDADSELFQPGASSRQRRAIPDECGDWKVDDKYHPIQEKEEFEADREFYNKRKSCLLTKSLGVPGARSEIYAGMFAGVKQPSNPAKYKLFTKFVSGVNFFGHEMEIGSFYFYHHSGFTKAYVRIMGKTRQEFRNEGCTESELRYHPVQHIPLYLVQVSVLQFSLGIHLSSNLGLETLCPAESVYDMTPQSAVRIGGEAMATVLFARGSMNIGGNFNYNLRFTFAPVPDMCLTGRQGYDPMSISLEAFYQLWNVPKFRWGKPRTWRPSFLKWQVSNGKDQLWFNDTCILKTGPVSTSPSASDPSLDDNELLKI